MLRRKPWAVAQKCKRSLVRRHRRIKASRVVYSTLGTGKGDLRLGSKGSGEVRLSLGGLRVD